MHKPLGGRLYTGDGIVIVDGSRLGLKGETIHVVMHKDFLRAEVLVGDSLITPVCGKKRMAPPDLCRLKVSNQSQTSCLLKTERDNIWL
jgi:hypothetical protein